MDGNKLKQPVMSKYVWHAKVVSDCQNFPLRKFYSKGIKTRENVSKYLYS